MQAVAALDLGEKTVGVAVSDSYLSVASPLETIRRVKFTLDAARVLEIAQGRRLGGIILGLPFNMDGSEGPRCQSTRAFARNLSRLTDLPLGFGMSVCQPLQRSVRCLRRIRHASVVKR